MKAKGETHMKAYAFVLALLIGALLSGCYTQLSTVKSEREEEYTYTRNDQEEDTTSYDSGSRGTYHDYDYDDWDRPYPRFRAYMNYYYPAYYWPSIGFTLAYSDPYYGWSWYGYDPWWCGTPQIVYAWPVYYYPYYYYPYSQSRWGHYAWGGGGVRTNRDFGSTRGGSMRTVGGGRGGESPAYDAPRSGGINEGSSAGRRGDVPLPLRVEPSSGRRSDIPTTRTPEYDGKGATPSNESAPPAGGRRGNEKDVDAKQPERAPADVRPAAPPTPPKEGQRGSQERRGVRDSGSRRDSSPRPQQTPPPSYNPPPSPPRSAQPSGGGGGSRDSGGGRGGRR